MQPSALNPGIQAEVTSLPHEEKDFNSCCETILDWLRGGCGGGEEDCDVNMVVRKNCQAVGEEKKMCKRNTETWRSCRVRPRLTRLRAVRGEKNDVLKKQKRGESECK